MFWLSRLTEHAGYPEQLLGPMLVTSSGLGLPFVPNPPIAASNVPGNCRDFAGHLPGQTRSAVPTSCCS